MMNRAEINQATGEMLEILQLEGVIRSARLFQEELSLRISHSPSRTSSWGGANCGRPRISLALYPIKWMAQRGRFHEYPRFNSHPDIGGINTYSPSAILLAILAHELAHAVQFSVGSKASAYMRETHAGRWSEERITVRGQGHGTLFQLIYQILRVQYVNPRIADEVETPRAAASLTEVLPWSSRAHLVREYLLRGQSTKSIITWAQEYFPNQKTDAKTVAWYRWKLRKEGKLQ